MARSRRRRWAPTRNPAINPRHPLAAGLLYAAGECTGWRDLVNGYLPSINVPCAHTPTQYGMGATTDATHVVTYGARAAGTYLDFTSQPFSAMWFASLPTVNTNAYPEGPTMENYTDETTNKGWSMVRRDNADPTAGLSFMVFSNSGNAVYAADHAGTSDGVTINQPFVFVGNNSGSSQKVYVDGVLRGTASSPNPVSVGTSWSFKVGANDIATNIFNAVWGRALGDREASMLSDDPFCFLTGR